MIRYTLTLLALGMACAASAQLPFRYVTVSEAEINNFQGSLDLIDTYKSYLLAEHPEHGSDWNFYTSNEGNGYFVFSYANLAAFEAARDAQKAADGAFWQGMMADSTRASKFMNADRSLGLDEGRTLRAQARKQHAPHGHDTARGQALPPQRGLAHERPG